MRCCPRHLAQDPKLVAANRRLNESLLGAVMKSNAERSLPPPPFELSYGLRRAAHGIFHGKKIPWEGELSEGGTFQKA